MSWRSSLAVGFFSFLVLSLSATEVVTLVDVDRDFGTGCAAHGFVGIDAIATTRIDTQPAGVVVSGIGLQRCVAGALRPVTEIPGGWGVPSDGTVTSIESAIPFAALGIERTTPARYGFVLLQPPAAPVLIPERGAMITFSAHSRRRSAAPAFEGTLAKADGQLGEWKDMQKQASLGRMDVWLQAGLDALVLRFDVRTTGSPVAVGDDYVVPFAGTLTIATPGVLSNDSDPDGDPLTAELLSPAAHGTVQLETDGSFVYQHDGTSAPADSFTYRATDGLTVSNAATVSITPVIVNARPVGADDAYSTDEDQALVISAPGVLGNDSDPDGDAMTATLISGPTSGALSLSADGSFTYTPAANDNGSVSFVYTVTDGTFVSDPVTVTIAIDAVNDAPTFAAGAAVVVNEDWGAYASGWATAISAGPSEAQALTFEVTGNTNPTLFSVAPSISSAGVLSFTLAADAHGATSVTVRVKDDGGTTNGGIDTSGAETFTITVNPVNDAPSFVMPAGAPAVDEDAGAQTVNNFTSSILAGPADEATQTLTFGLTQTAIDPTLTFTIAPAIAADGTLTYSAAANGYGTATYSVVLSDNGSGTAPDVNTSAAQTFTITINPVNDAPSSTIAADPAASSEDAGLQTVAAFATSISQGPNETGQTLTFTVTPTGSTGTLTFSGAPSIAADGTLTYTATANTSGTATFNVVLTDSGSNVAPNVHASGTQSFTITVNAVNDAPSFVMPASAPAVDEDAGAQTVNNFTSSILAGPADESTQTLTFAVTQTAIDPTLTFTIAPAIAADGTLTYTAAANAYGTATFSVVLSDNGSGTAPDVNTSAAQTFTITINPVNDAPSSTIAADPAASNEDAGLQTVSAFATSISQGPNETGQTLTFTVTPTGSTGTLTFSGAPAIAADGTLTYTAAANTTGTATFNVVLTDNGSNVAPHSNASGTQSFTITVNAVNDAPSFVMPASAPAVDEDGGAQTVNNFTSSIVAGPADESAQTLTFAVTQTAIDPTLTFTVAPAIAADGTLTYTAAANAYGTATFSVVLSDNGSGTAPNVNTSAAQTLTITINPINDAPSSTIAADPAASNEDAGLQTVSAFATSISQGPNETGQTLTFTLTPTGSTGTLAHRRSRRTEP
jgi:VCBS repeat-containing protein